MPPRFPRLKEEFLPKGASQKILLTVVNKVNERYKKERDKEDKDDAITLLGDSVFSEPRGYVSSGILPVDCIICYGLGFPVGIVEIFGPEASGKTAIMENVLAESQRNNYYTILFPTEYSLDYARSKKLGLDENKLMICDVETIEDVYEQLKFIVREIRKKDKTTPIVIGWDSVAATPTRSELAAKAGLESSDMGKMALQMSKLFRRLVRFLFINKVCLICVNQTRANIGVMWGSKESTFGGRALKFYAWVRCRMSRVKTLENAAGEKIGYIMEMRCVKNKVAPPERTCKLPLYFDGGISKPLSIWEYATAQGVFTRKGTAFRFGKALVTRKTFTKFYLSNKNEIDAAIRKSTAVRSEV